MAMEKLWRVEYESPVGRMVLVAGREGLRGAWFEGQKYFMRGVMGEVRPECTVVQLGSGVTAQQSGPRLASAVVRQECEVLRLAKAWLEQYFAGRVPNVQVSLDPRGTEFQKLVWGLLRQIPYGKTATYGDLARQVAAQLGRKTMSAQAVGGAVGRNPISLFVPCHRVFGSHGELTGYAGGIERKQWLLRHEQTHSEDSKTATAT